MDFLIMAGGRGVRLWPLSRSSKPKQFQNIVSDLTLLQETVVRVSSVAQSSQIYVSTNKQYLEEVYKELPQIPISNVISEPFFRERSASIVLACAFLEVSGSDIITLLPSDHWIKSSEVFIKTLLKGGEFVKNNPHLILTVGTAPTNPEVGYGYIKQGDSLGDGFYKVDSFHEKPDVSTASNYIATGRYLWNSGVYICRITTLMAQFAIIMPEMYKIYLALKKAVKDKNEQAIEVLYKQMQSVSFEQSIIEKNANIVVLCADFGWSDVGSWCALKNILATSSQENVIKASKNFDMNSQNILVYGNERFIATAGLKDVVIVDTPDVLLVCSKKDSQVVKDLVADMQQNNYIDFL